MSNAASQLQESGASLKLDAMDKEKCTLNNVLWLGEPDRENSFNLVPSSTGYTLHANSECDMCAIEATEMPGIVLGPCASALVFTKTQ
eukprot:SAG31_NODE_10176_length_1175_cov_0.932156_1_plen_88_part_00